MAIASPARRCARFDQFEVDLAAAELRKSGQRIALQDQPFQILRLLVEAAPEIVTREQIRSALWPSDTFVDFDLAINTAVRKLRQALEDSIDQPKFIQTLAKQGYRFIAKMDWTTGAGQPRPKWPLWKIALVLTTPVLIALLLVPRPAPPPPLIAVPVTALQGAAGWLSFSPDGQQIVFGWNKDEDNWNYFVQSVGGPAQPFQLTHFRSPVHIASQATWSPDGKWISYAKWSPVVGQKPVEIVLVPAPMGGQELSLLRINVPNWGPISWSPDAKYLAYLDHDFSDQRTSIYLLRRDTLERTRLTSPPKGSEDSFAVFSPDGRQIAFVRSVDNAISELTSIELTSHRLKVLSREVGEIRGLAWNTGGKEVIYSSNRGGFFRLWRVSATGSKPWPLPVGEDGVNPTVCSRTNRLAYGRAFDDSNIWRINLPEGKKIGSRTPLIVSSRLESQPAFSSDETKIAFVSDRSGFDEIWACDSDGSDHVQLTHFGLHKTGTPRWSPAGMQVAFDARVRGHSDIFLVSLNGADPRRVTDDGFDDSVPSWSADGKWIYYRSDHAGDVQVWKIPAEGGRPTQVTRLGGAMALESPDGRTLYYVSPTDDKSGVGKRVARWR